jgi:hypothetical protein
MVSMQLKGLQSCEDFVNMDPEAQLVAHLWLAKKLV